LAHEIGEALQSGAYLTMLRRTRNGQFSEKDAVSLDDFLKNLPLDETKE
jgi:tRNA pseudouridine55 synthase